MATGLRDAMGNRPGFLLRRRRIAGLRVAGVRQLVYFALIFWQFDVIHHPASGYGVDNPWYSHQSENLISDE